MAVLSQKNIRRTSVLLAVVSLFVMMAVPGVVWAAFYACTSYHWMPACRVYCVRVPPDGGPFAPCALTHPWEL
jgi:hypothetical protein